MASLIDSLRLLAATFNRLIHFRKEVARIHVNDSALAQFSKWEYEVGTNELFPFDVAKKCDEIHKTKKLGKPIYKFKSNVNDQYKRFRSYYNMSLSCIRGPIHVQFGPSVQPNGRSFGNLTNQVSSIHYTGGLNEN